MFGLAEGFRAECVTFPERFRRTVPGMWEESPVAGQVVASPVTRRFRLASSRTVLVVLGCLVLAPDRRLRAARPPFTPEPGRRRTTFPGSSASSGR